jgi:tRNA(Ile)-lysidine synthase TilS/MesJ
MIKVNLVADMDCDRCGRPAVIFQQYSGLSYCAFHLAEDIRRKGKKTVRHHAWLKSGDRIAFPCSGELSSIALMDFLNALINGRKDIGTLAIVSGDLRELKTWANISGICETDMNFVVPAGQFTRGQVPGIADLYRRRDETEQFLASVARKNNATTLAMPYSLLDHAEWTLWKAVNGEFPGSGGKKQKNGDTFRIIRPFMHIPDEELAIYARSVVSHHFPGAGRDPLPGQERTLIGRLLEEFGRGHPGAQFALVNIREEMAELTRRTYSGTPFGRR